MDVVGFINIVVNMVGLPRFELGTCGIRELSRMLAFANKAGLRSKNGGPSQT